MNEPNNIEIYALGHRYVRIIFILGLYVKLGERDGMETRLGNGGGGCVNNKLVGLVVKVSNLFS